jgi:hypothetical protein
VHAIWETLKRVYDVEFTAIHITASSLPWDRLWPIYRSDDPGPAPAISSPALYAIMARSIGRSSAYTSDTAIMVLSGGRRSDRVIGTYSN